MFVYGRRWHANRRKKKTGIGWLVYPLPLRESITDMYMHTDSIYNQTQCITDMSEITEQVSKHWGLLNPDNLLQVVGIQVEVVRFEPHASICGPHEHPSVCVLSCCSHVQTTLSDPMDRSPPGSSVDWILQARILEWHAISFSKSILAIEATSFYSLLNKILLI